MDHREQLAAVFDDVETKLRGAIGAYNTLSAKYETSHRDNAEIGRDIWPLGDWLAKLERATYSFKRFRSVQLSEERPSLPPDLLAAARALLDECIGELGNPYAYPPSLGALKRLENAAAVRSVDSLRPPEPSFDWERVVAWIRAGNRAPAVTAFTAGAERQVAYAVEDMLRGADSVAAPEETKP